MHVDRYSLLPKRDDTVTIYEGLNRRMRKIMEAAHISINDVTNPSEGFLYWAKPAAATAETEQAEK